mgnify:CR=1 FL=1
MDNEGDLQESYRADYSSVELAFDLKNITLNDFKPKGYFKILDFRVVR